MILRGTIFSKVLEMDTGITVVGPDTFDGKGPYSVIYLLHGLCGSSGSWADNTMLPYYARSLGALFVLPEVGRSFYTDLKYGQRFFTYVSEELPEFTARLFNISAQRENTAVMGGSMGGFGALKCALSRPDFFGLCAAFAPAGLFLAEQLAAFGSGGEGPRGPRDGWKPNAQLQRDFLAMFGEKLQSGEGDDLIRRAKAVQAKERPHIYLSCGEDDGFLPELRRFKKELGEIGFEINYQELPGGHNWRFFDQALEKTLTWKFGVDFGKDQGRYKKI